jgi:hypothetical protein
VEVVVQENSTQRVTVALAGALGLVVIAVGLLGWQLAVAKSDVTDLTAELKTTQSRLDEVEATAASADQLLSGLGTVTSDLEDLRLQVDSMVGGSSLFASSSFSEVDDRIDALISCVNEYMETVGDAGGGRYYYYLCR